MNSEKMDKWMKDAIKLFLKLAKKQYFKNIKQFKNGK